jgi:hypothetical protein
MQGARGANSHLVVVKGPLWIESRRIVAIESGVVVALSEVYGANGPLWDECAFVLIVLRRGVRDAQWKSGAPSERFLYQCLYVRQTGSVC